MKRTVVTFWVFAFFMVTAMAQSSQPGHGDMPTQRVNTNRVYKVFVNNASDSASVAQTNEALYRGGAANRGVLTGLGIAIASSYANMLVQKTVTATTNAMSTAVKLISAWIHKDKNDREAWLKAVRQQNHFERCLGTDICIDDFYYTGSTYGALDPMNMKFSGFGCKCTMTPTRAGNGPHARRDRHSDKKPGGSSEAAQENTEEGETIEFYVMCKLRLDSVGIHHIVNHSKFYVDVDQLVFDTRHTSLPNDSVPVKEQRKFDFRGRKNLTFTLNVKVFSSWVNEAIILTENQQIGEFNITARIDSGDLTDDAIFVYDPVKHREKVSVTGDCFLVPRSYTGTAESPSWGTGQYRLVMTISERCDLNENWYKLPSKGKRDSLLASTPGKKAKTRWDKKKWKPEWKEMQAHRREPSAWNSLWQSVSVAYIGKDWVQELVSPLTSAVSSTEKVELSKLLNINGSSTVPSSAASPLPSGGTPSNGSSAGSTPSGGTSPGGSQPGGN